jgi:site-specific recombinase XerD
VTKVISMAPLKVHNSRVNMIYSQPKSELALATGFTAKVIWSIVKQAAANSGLSGVAPHDLRRTCAKLCHQAGGELEQIQFLLGHVSVQTTERYLGCKQRFRNAVNDRIGLEPDQSGTQ